MSNAPQAPQYPMVYKAPVSSKLQNLALITGAIGGVLLVIYMIIILKDNGGSDSLDILWPLANVAIYTGGGLISASVLILAGAIAMKGIGR